MVRSLVYSVLALFLGCSDPIEPYRSHGNTSSSEVYLTSDRVASWEILRNPGGRIIRQKVTFNDPRQSKPCRNYALVRESYDEARVTFRVESAASDCRLGDLENRFWTVARLANRNHDKPVSRN